MHSQRRRQGIGYRYRNHRNGLPKLSTNGGHRASETWLYMSPCALLKGLNGACCRALRNSEAIAGASQLHRLETRCVKAAIFQAAFFFSSSRNKTDIHQREPGTGSAPSRCCSTRADSRDGSFLAWIYGAILFVLFLFSRLTVRVNCVRCSITHFGWRME